MFPRLGPLPFPTSYGVLVALGLVLALHVAGRLAPRRELSPRQVRDALVWACLWGLLGAKLLLIVVDLPAFLEAPQRVLFQGGVFYGGFIGAVLSMLWSSRKYGFSVLAMGDVVAPALALGHAVGRVGCFLAGCCWGSECSLPWAVRYTDPDAIAYPALYFAGHAVHPVQIYEALGLLLLGGLLTLLLFKWPGFLGRVWWSYVGGYALLRLTTEQFRADPRGFWFDGALSTSRLIGLLALGAAAVAMAVLSWRAKRQALEVLAAEPGGVEDALCGDEGLSASADSQPDVVPEGDPDP